MFHSNSFRHEQYIRSTISNSSKATLNKQRSSLESEGADSGYNSSSSISPSTHEETKHVTKTTTESISTISTLDDTSLYSQQQPKKSSIKNQSSRQPDLVYSCPRPLAFPFHNDDHFLPIAEADPRDVARVSPIASSLLDRSLSTSSSTALLKKDTDSSYSRHSSILSTIQRGTVRSLRSLFQLPSSSSNTITCVQSNTSNKSSLYNQQRLEIKQGTVQSIKNLFKRVSISTSTNPLPPPSPPSPLTPKKGLVTKAIHQFESKQKSPVMGLKMNVTPSAQSRKSTLTQRAKDFSSKLFHKSSASTPQPIPTTPNADSKIKTQAKRISKVFNWKSTTKTADTSPPTPPKPKKSIFAAFKKPKEDSTTLDTTPKPKKSFFSFKKPQTQEPSLKKDPTVTLDEPPKKPTAVKKMWKSFKNLMTGKKSSRIGIM